MKAIKFSTGNDGKVAEVRQALEDTEFSVEKLEVDIHEIDSGNVEEVARRKAKDSREYALEKGSIGEDSRILVEDTGLYVEGIGGFPATHASFFASTVGAEKLLDLMRDIDERDAYFRSVFALCDGDEISTFSGELDGRITEIPRGEPHPHLPYNSIFQPKNADKTIAEMEELKQHNHRAKAVQKLVEYLRSTEL